MRKIESGQFSVWLKKLRDDTARARIVARVNRLMEGLAGDVSPVGHGISELRIHVGPGYRVYFYQRGDTFVAPTWTHHSHHATSDTLLFCLSDEPLMRAFKYYRSEPA